MHIPKTYLSLHDVTGLQVTPGAGPDRPLILTIDGTHGCTRITLFLQPLLTAQQVDALAARDRVHFLEIGLPAAGVAPFGLPVRVRRGHQPRVETALRVFGRLRRFVRPRLRRFVHRRFMIRGRRRGLSKNGDAGYDLCFPRALVFFRAGTTITGHSARFSTPPAVLPTTRS